MIETAARSSSAATCVLIFPEGTRIRPGSLGHAQARRRAPGARDRRARRPRRRHRHRGRPPGLAHPPAQGPHPRRPRRCTSRSVDEPSPQLAAGGHRPHLALRDAAVGVARRAAAAAPRASSSAPARAGTGLAVDARPRAASRSSSAAAPPSRRARWRATRSDERYLPGVRAARRRRRAHAPPTSTSPPPTSCASPSPRPRLPAALAEHGARVPTRAGVLVLAKGARAAAPARCPPPTSPSACARARGRLARRPRATPPTRSCTAPRSCSPPHDAAFASQLADVLRAAGSTCHRTSDVAGVELAGAAKNAAALAAAAAGVERRPQRRRRRRRQGVRRGRRVRARRRRAARDVRRPGRRRRPRRHRRRRAAAATAAPARCSAPGCPARDIAPSLGQAAEAVDTVPLLADAMRRPASRRRPSTAWPRWSRAASSPSGGRAR